MRSYSPASAIHRFRSKDAISYDEGAALVERNLDTGMPFKIDRLRCGYRTLNLAVPLEVYARTGIDGFVVWSEDMLLYGYGDTPGATFRDFSSCVMAALHVFCKEDSMDPEFGRQLEYHVGGAAPGESPFDHGMADEAVAQGRRQ